MTNREREIKTLSFAKFDGRGSVEETFFPWDLTIKRFLDEGLPDEYSFDKIIRSSEDRKYRYHSTLMTDGVNEFERYLGFDSVKRLGFFPPVSCFENEVLEVTNKYTIKRDSDGWTRKYFNNNKLTQELKPVVTCTKDWNSLKEKILVELNKYFTDDVIRQTYTQFKKGHINGEYSIRFRILGFFWIPRDLLGVEEHMLTFNDKPALLHDINEFILDIYLKYLGKVLDIISPDVMLICEDLSGANGPMLSPDTFNEFVGAYYKRLIPFLKAKGVKSVFVDTDGDFRLLIPNFIDAGVDGFLPMDVNAGMDIVKTREMFPSLQFIGGYNKLCIAEGKNAIDKEFERIMPVIRQGGYIPGTDHQVAPSTSFENYKYYISKLKEAMKQSGINL